MSRLSFTVASLVVAALCTLHQASAQQPTPATPIPPDQLGQPNQPGTLPDRLQTDQADGSQNDQSDRYEARRVTGDTNQQGMTVKEAIVQKLKKANEAEIELAKLAIQKTDNEEVKQFAQTLVQDHQACVQKLQQKTGHNPSGKRNAGQSQPEKTPAAKSSLGDQGQSSGSHSATVPSELIQIAKHACDNSLKMTKEMLSNYDGQDFDMAFLGQQCVAHTMMLAELKAIESVGPQELQMLAQESSEKVQQHLDKAKELAKKLEDDRKKKS